MTKRCFIAIAILFATLSLIGQSQEDLEQKRQRILQHILTTKKLLHKTTNNSKDALSHYETLQTQIENRAALLKNLSDELDAINANKGKTTTILSALEADLKKMEIEYGRLLRAAYRQKINNKDWLFVFNAESLKQGFQRFQYLKQYHAFRKKQVNLILNTQKSLAEKLQAQQKEVLNKKELKAEQEIQQQQLKKEQEKKYALYQKLKKDATGLGKKLKQQQQTHEALNVAIEATIKKQMLRKRQASRNLTNSESTISSKGVLKNLSIAFEQQKGQLAWPVKQGIISKEFGIQAHPTIENATIKNNGIEIRTDAKAKVQAVFDGLLLNTSFIPGFGYMAIVQHGDYFTIYSKLEEVFLIEGETIEAGQTIGQLQVEQDGNTSVLHFEVWENKTRMNPANWLSDSF